MYIRLNLWLHRIVLGYYAFLIDVYFCPSLISVTTFGSTVSLPFDNLCNQLPQKLVAQTVSSLNFPFMIKPLTKAV